MRSSRELCARSLTVGRYRSDPVGTGNNRLMDTPGERAYRRFLVAFGLVAGLLAAFIGARFILRGQGFYGFLARCVVGFIVLVIHGYRQESGD